MKALGKNTAFILAQIITCAVACHSTTTLRERHFDQHDDWWSIEIKYPTIEGNNTFNSAIHKHVVDMASSFRKSLPRTASKGYPDYGAYLTGKYTAQILKNGIVSILFDYSEYTPGAAHPWGVQASINYDPHSARVLTLSDLFRPGSDYVSLLSEKAIRLLSQDQELPDQEMIRTGAGPEEKNFRVFTVTDQKLVLHFQQYQVGPGVVPALAVEIPFSELHPLLRMRFTTD